ncbi:MAG: hypothetical protein V4515_05445 [Chloroflexota bacterium]
MPKGIAAIEGTEMRPHAGILRIGLKTASAGSAGDDGQLSVANGHQGSKLVWLL